MTNNGIVNIHGREYMTVARRVELAHEASSLDGIETEILSHDPIVVRARVIVNGKVFTGMSAVAVDSTKTIERENPYEVAETSAVGRALGFAGYGLIESVASADEMVRAINKKANNNADKAVIEESDVTCEVCGKPATERRGVTKVGKPYHGIFCSTDNKSHTRWIWN
jgi:hypothetical protein